MVREQRHRPGKGNRGPKGFYLFCSFTSKRGRGEIGKRRGWSPVTKKKPLEETGKGGGAGGVNLLPPEQNDREKRRGGVGGQEFNSPRRGTRKEGKG